MFRNASKSLTTSDEVYEYALSLLDRREHGEKELVQKLKRRCPSSELIRETVAKLKEYDLLNEERYARRVFESWRARKVYGRLHLQAELIKSGRGIYSCGPGHAERRRRILARAGSVPADCGQAR